MKNLKSNLIWFVPFVLILSACGWPTPKPAQPTGTDFSVMLTYAYEQTATAQVLATPEPTTIPEVPTATATSLPQIIPTPTPCNKAVFVQDVTYPDGTNVKPGESMQKTWRLRNEGTCIWSGYSMVFYEGTNMGSNLTAINATVNPGDSVDISIALTAPNSTGTYTGYYRLRDASGNTFGITSRSGEVMSFWVSVKVQLSQVTYDMVNDAPNATWEDGLGLLSFNTDAGSGRGAVFDATSPTMEDKAHENDRGLEVRPNNASQGYQQGTFPYYTVQQGDHFITAVSCRNDAKQCYMKFQLSYREEGGAPFVLASWAERYDGLAKNVDVDLSRLAGKRVALILTIFAEGDPIEDVGIWLHPRIMR